MIHGLRIQLTDDKIKLPPNFNILGTVNTSDQNVFVMDTAFKRRFEWQYISTKPVPVGGPYKNNIDIEVVLDNAGTKKTVKWVDLYGTLNKFIADSRFLGLGEDKQLGQFFIEFQVGGTPSEHKNQVKNKNIIPKSCVSPFSLTSLYPSCLLNPYKKSILSTQSYCIKCS